MTKVPVNTEESHITLESAFHRGYYLQLNTDPAEKTVVLVPDAQYKAGPNIIPLAHETNLKELPLQKDGQKKFCYMHGYTYCLGWYDKNDKPDADKSSLKSKYLNVLENQKESMKLDFFIEKEGRDDLQTKGEPAQFIMRVIQ